MNCGDSQFFFKDVPEGSTVEVELKGTPGDFAAVVELIGPTHEGGALGPGDSWTSNPLLRIKPKTVHLLRIILTHNRPVQTTATVVIRVRRPNGTTHSSPITCSSTGRSGDPVDIGLWAIVTD